MVDDNLFRELERRVSVNEQRIDWLDQNGTRGIAPLTQSVSIIQRDMGKLEGAINAFTDKLNALDDKIDNTRQRSWPTMLGFALALLPMYALVITLIVNRN